MTLVRWNPYRGFESMVKRMNDLVGDYDSEREVDLNYGTFAPRVDIKEDEKNIYVHAEMPGLKKDDVKVTVNDDNILTIKGEKKAEDKKEDETYVRMERMYGTFTRSFMLPDNVDKDSISAKFEDGVLNVTLNKKEPEKPKEIDVNIE